jgi:hypothetical protein
LDEVHNNDEGDGDDDEDVSHLRHDDPDECHSLIDDDDDRGDDKDDSLRMGKAFTHPMDWDETLSGMRVLSLVRDDRLMTGSEIFLFRDMDDGSGSRITGIALLDSHLLITVTLCGCELAANRQLCLSFLLQLKSLSGSGWIRWWCC